MRSEAIRSQTVTLAAIVLTVAALVVRGWLVATGNFYWDDLILIGRASSSSILSWDFLGHSHDGHFMPATFLVAGVSTMIAPVEWFLPAATLLLLQGLASLAVWRMIRVLAPGARLGALAALAFYLFTPMTMPAFAWWAAGLNSLPMQAAMAWIVADAVLLVRGERPARVVAIRSTIVFLVALAFFEKSLLILPVALVAAVLSVSVAAAASPLSDDAPSNRFGIIRATLTRGRTLWVPLTAVFVGWGVLFWIATDPTAGDHSWTQTAQLVWRSITHAVVPSLTGGPWSWDRWTPSPPMGFPTIPMMVIGWLLLAAAVAWAVLRAPAGRRPRAIVIVVATVIYVIAAQIPVMWNRSSGNTALELAQTMRYLPDAALVITIAWALLLNLHGAARGESNPDVPRGRHASSTPESAGISPAQVGGLTLAVLLVASSVMSLVGFGASWRDNPTGDYLATAKQSLQDNRDHVMFDQAVPLEVLLPVAYPNNTISHIFGRVRDRAQFGVVTDEINVLDDTGTLVPGGVTPHRGIVAGRGSCARPEVDGPTQLTLDGPLLRWKWTVALSYCANSDGEIDVALAGTEPVRVPVQAGLHAVYIQVEGSGPLTVRPVTPGLALHTGDGRIGEVADARFLN